MTTPLRPTRMLALLLALTSGATLGACGTEAPSADSGDNTGSGAGGPGPNTGSASGLGGGAASGSAPGVGGTSAPPPGCEDGDCPGSVSACDASTAGSPVLRRLTVRELSALVDSTFPEISGKWSSSLSPDSVSASGFENQADLLVASDQFATELDATLTSVGQAVEAAVPKLLPCATATPDDACAGEFISKYGKRLFRRPPSTDESVRYLSYFKSALEKKNNFANAIGWVTQALLSSPRSLYRYELGTPNGDSRTLDQYELASALAFTFSGAPPSDALLEKADRGELSSADSLTLEAESLILSPAGQDILLRFFESNFEYGHVAAITKPGLQDFATLRTQMIQETRTFIEHTILAANGGVKDLLTSPVTYPSKGLATVYGFPVPANDYDPVTRPVGRGIGLLAQGSVLATEAGPDASSPTQRGLLVFERLLCREKPPVPPGIPPIPPVQTGKVTTRQRYEEVHASGGVCAECHANFDPIGFAFEHYNEFGQFRETEGGLAINATGNVPMTSLTFDNQEELAQGLAELPEVGACISAYLKTYAFGSTEACLGEAGRDAFAKSEIGLVDYWKSLAKEPHFQERRLR